jgi:pimeloyl-ACP methyl ester carboxylesterase
MGRRRRLLLVLPILFVGYAAVATFGGCADRFILYPQQGHRDAHGADRQMIPHGDGTLEFFTARSPGAAGREPAALVLEFTGNATRAEDIAAYVAGRWQHRPVEVWVMNYPGYGGSTGPARLKSFPPAALAAYDHVKRVAGDRPILLAGNSLGSTSALYIAARRPAAAVIIQNPPPLRNLILGRFGWWNLWLVAGPVAAGVPRELDSLANAPRVPRPAMFVIAGRDGLVPPKYQRKVADAYAGEKRVIVLDGAGHNDPVGEEHEAEVQAALDWLFESAIGTRTILSEAMGTPAGANP